MCAKIASPAGTSKKGGAKMASIFKRGDVLYIQYMLNGKKVQRSTKLKDTPKNRAYIKNEVIPALERKIAQGIPEDKRLIKYAKIYLLQKESLKTYFEISGKVDVILDFFGKNTDVDTIKPSHIRGWLNSIKRKKSTILKYKGVLKGILDMALEDEVIDKNPCENIQLNIKEPKPNIEPFSQDEIKKILSTSTGWFRNFFGIALYTGMRTGELLALSISDITDTHIYVRRSVRNGIIASTKTDNERAVPIFTNTKTFLNSQIEYAKKHKSIYLFSRENGEPFKDSYDLRPYWKKVCTACKIANKRLYNTRHTFIVQMLKSGKLSVMEISRIVGHSSPEMIYRNYAKHIKSELINVNKDFDPFADIFADSTNLKESQKAL